MANGNDIIDFTSDTDTSNLVSKDDIVDNLTTEDDTKILSANQGKVLKSLIDAIQTLLTSDDVNLDELQEIVNYIKQNRDELENLSVANIAGLQEALDNKYDKSGGVIGSGTETISIEKNEIHLNSTNPDNDADRKGFIINAYDDGQAIEIKIKTDSGNINFIKMYANGTLKVFDRTVKYKKARMLKRKTRTQNINTSRENTIVIMDNIQVEKENFGIFEATDNGIKILKDGYYDIVGQVRVQYFNDSWLYTKILKNGSTIHDNLQEFGAGYGTHKLTAYSMHLLPDDVIELAVYSDSDDDYNIQGGYQRTFLMVEES